MGFVSDQVKGTIASAAVYTALPDEVNQAREVVSEVLPENMKAVLGAVVLTGSFVAGVLRGEKE